MANVFMLEITSPILEIPDVNSYNLYFGWYLGELDQNDDFLTPTTPNTPTAASVFELRRRRQPAYQSAHPKGRLYRNLPVRLPRAYGKMIADRPWLWATHVWNMFDFAADGRDEGGKTARTRRGLSPLTARSRRTPSTCTKPTGAKRPFIAYLRQPLCGPHRGCDRGQVYSNLPEGFAVQGRAPCRKRKRRQSVCFNVPITGKHSIEARAGGIPA